MVLDPLVNGRFRRVSRLSTSTSTASLKIECYIGPFYHCTGRSLGYVFPKDGQRYSTVLLLHSLYGYRQEVRDAGKYITRGTSSLKDCIYHYDSKVRYSPPKLRDDRATTLRTRDRGSTMAWRGDRCILHSAKICIDLVTRKCSNRRSNFDIPNACSNSYPALFCASSGTVERYTTTEILFCLELDPKASP
jgi:hypothetical protein